mmetsp:Transcript_32566/g.85580  ORF Transcript_32566/g.85580 Transcript_32566/m.85580 type:complete len:341 (+) Transcript_32566:200-1222(+)
MAMPRAAGTSARASYPGRSQARARTTLARHSQCGKAEGLAPSLLDLQAGDGPARPPRQLQAPPSWKRTTESPAQRMEREGATGSSLLRNRGVEHRLLARFDWRGHGRGVRKAREVPLGHLALGAGELLHHRRLEGLEGDTPLRISMGEILLERGFLNALEGRVQVHACDVPIAIPVERRECRFDRCPRHHVGLRRDSRREELGVVHFSVVRDVHLVEELVKPLEGDLRVLCHGRLELLKGEGAGVVRVHRLKELAQLLQLRRWRRERDHLERQLLEVIRLRKVDERLDNLLVLVECDRGVIALVHLRLLLNPRVLDGFGRTQTVLWVLLHQRRTKVLRLC